MDSSLTHRFVNVNGVRLHIAEQGQGPLVLLLHGWPESWHSWRHQFGPLAAAQWCCRVAGTGRSRSVPPRLTPRSSTSSPASTDGVMSDDLAEQLTHPNQTEDT